MAKTADGRESWRKLLLVAMMLAYIVIFTKLAFDQHAAMRTHQADLGQIDQAIWNSSRGRFLEFTRDDRQSVRLTDHVEPIFVLISPVFWLWDDVRALLLLQAIFVAMGAWPLYALAKGKTTPNLALSLVAAYFLAPPLQSALLTDFHAIPLAVPFILWAFWAAEAQKWGQFAIAVLLLAAVKEEAALLAAGLGLWAVWVAGRRRMRRGGDGANRGWMVGLALALVALGWFAVATFAIVPAHAADVYGVDASIYFHRYGALGDSLADILKSLVFRPGLVVGILLEPARLRYLAGLFAAFGFLGLAGVDVIILCLPLLLANLLSAYPAQYYGEFHYTAPLIPFFAVAAAYGTGRLLRLRVPNRLAIIWLLAWAVGLYWFMGRGPLGGRYDPAPATNHHQMLDRFTSQLPSDAAVSATTAVHPHISHRRFAYPFPNGVQTADQADWALIDVTTATDMAPGNVRDVIEQMLANDWGVVDAADGFLLLRRGVADKTIPAAFYDFTRRQADGTTPSAPLTLLGVEVEDRPLWRQSQIITRWQVGDDYTDGLRPWLQVLTPNEERIYAFDDLTPPALIWHPPADWRPGETITITTPPLSLPLVWGIAAGIAHGPNPAQPADRLPLEDFLATPALLTGDRLDLVSAYHRDAESALQTLDEDALLASDFGASLAQRLGEPISQTTAGFLAPGGTTIGLQAWLPGQSAQRGRPLDLWLRWLDGIPDGYVAFVHLRQGKETVAQADGPPRLFLIQPGAKPVNDWRQLSLPSNVSAGVPLEVVVGLYSLANGSRLELVDADGQSLGSELNLGQVTSSDPPVPDQTCALIPTTCASQP